ncbi:trans-aconitate 2-methyltransferase [Hymenobacter sp. BT559]|uniref:class I SAM-dependent methyltransferase n=1 Tax=Hymenobacter sp. BT559 TaxID=2795729 RepID=UPI0018EAC246|nr:class I SAM-dependent methyltransferase [Hymenobacter sp. BT559]MBJ6143931.1 class I SAM-dependent methyltransferase [Hymenobacter sp. BT559]
MASLRGLPLGYTTYMHNPLGPWLDTAAILRYHRQRIREYGPGGAEALGWARSEGQQVRFQTLTQIGDLAYRSVLDAGCGYADLYPYLRARFAGVQYHGIEHMPELLAVAQARYHGAADITLSEGDFLRTPPPPADYVLASGALNYRPRNPQFIYRSIEKLFGSCRLGFGFNLLSWEPAGGGPLAAYEPAVILAFCEQLAPRVELLEGYWEGDFTIFMYR